MKQLILVGGGGHCKSIIDIAESIGYSIVGILDMPEHVGKRILNYSITGIDEDVSSFVDTCEFLITLGHIDTSSLREILYHKVKSKGGKLATLIAKTSHISKYSIIEEGTVIMHNSAIGPDTIIGKNCIINTFANIEHDVHIGDFCHISTGAIVNGGCNIGLGTFLGSQSVVVNGLSIIDNCLIAAGSVVCKDIDTRGMYAGNPAKKK